MSEGDIQTDETEREVDRQTRRDDTEDTEDTHTHTGHREEREGRRHVDINTNEIYRRDIY